MLAGTDTAGTVAGEVAHLARLGLDPVDALAAASTTARAFLGADAAGRADVVTYHNDPRGDLDELAHPAAVIVDGVRQR